MHNIPDFLRIPSEMQEHFAKGGMIKRADGSYSRRGLWDNIRANKGSGRKPTKEMLEQEAKIRSEEQYGGRVEEFGNGGYTVRRSSERKGKTHVVIGPDGTKKYFGDSKLGQHPKDPARKKAFYARHKHNLANNPYFRAFARATWAEGGEVPHFEDGGNYGAFYGRRDAAKMQGMFNPTANSMTPSFFAMGGLNQYQSGSTVALNQQQPGTYNLGQMGPGSEGNYSTQTANSGQGINTTTSQPSLVNSGFSNNPFIMGAMNNAQNAMIATNPNQPINNGGQGPTAANMVTGQSMNQTMMDQGQDALADEDLGLPTIMGNEGFGQNIKLGSGQQSPSTATTSTTTSTATTNTPATNNSNNKNSAAGASTSGDSAKHEHYLEGEHLALQGLGKLPYGVANMARTVTSLNKNAPQNAAQNLATRFMSDSTNSQVVYGNRGRVNQGGVKYTKYGGSTSFKEGEVLDLSFEEIKKLKDQGYEFQYL